MISQRGDEKSDRGDRGDHEDRGDRGEAGVNTSQVSRAIAKLKENHIGGTPSVVDGRGGGWGSNATLPPSFRRRDLMRFFDA